MVSARRMDRAALLPQRRGRHVGAAPQLVRHGRQHLRPALGPPHAAAATGEERGGECVRGGRGRGHGGRVLGMGGADLRARGRGVHV